MLLRHPKIENAAVVAMPDERLGEKVCAFVKPLVGQTITLEEVTAFLKDKRMAIFMWPERLELIDELPLTNVGKVQKRDLQQRLREMLKAEAGGQ